MSLDAENPVPDEDDDFGLAALIPQYMELCRKDLATLQTALSTDDIDRVRRLGHNLKGSGAAYGFPEITEFGRELESAAQSDDRPAIEHGISQLAAFLALHP